MAVISGVRMTVMVNRPEPILTLVVHGLKWPKTQLKKTGAP